MACAIASLRRVGAFGRVKPEIHPHLQSALIERNGPKMAPEEVHSLVAISLRLEQGRLIADGERVELPGGLLYVSWYATSPADNQVSIAGGLVQRDRGSATDT
jgi:hypothetical protein